MGEVVEEATEHGGGGSEDSVVLVPVLPHVEGLAVSFSLFEGDVGGIEEVVERWGDDFSDLDCERSEGVGGSVDEADVGGDVEVGHGSVVGLLAEHFDVFGSESDFFVGFAEGSGHGVFVDGVEGASGEGNFALVVLDLVGADGEDDLRVVVGEEGDEHGGAPASDVGRQGLDVVAPRGLADLADGGGLGVAIDVIGHCLGRALSGCLGRP